MSVAALNWAWSQQAPSSTAKLVLVALADHANADGECWPSMGSVAELAQCSPRQVSRCIDALEEAGLLSRTRRRLTAGRLGSYSYRLPIKNAIQPPDTRDHKTPASSGHLRPVDTPDQWSPVSTTTGHPCPPPPDTHVRSEPPVEPPVNRHGARKRARQVPDDWQPTADLRADLAAKHPRVDLDRELEKFRNHHIAKGSTFKNIERAYRNWIMKAEEFGNVRQSGTTLINADGSVTENFPW